MNTAKNPNFTTLLFRSEDSRHTLAQPLALQLDHYYPVTSYPKIEMIDGTPYGAAESFLQLTYMPAWKWAARRPICPGDVFTHAPDVYMFVDTAFAEQFTTTGMQLFGFAWCPQLMVARFNEKYILCKESN